MSAGRVFTPENRLAKALASFSGPSERELVASAQARIDGLKGVVQSYVAEKLQTLLTYADMREEDLFAESRELGAHARDVAEVAGAAGLSEVGEVAGGVCAMIDSLLRRGVWHTDALRLHLDALTLLNQRAAAAPENQAVLARLRHMREAIGVLE
jgi:hypothetical protein